MLVGGWVVAYEQSLSEGLRTERRLFHMTFATEDQREGTWSIFWSERVIPPSDAGDIRHDGLCGKEKAKLHKLVNWTDLGTMPLPKIQDHKYIDWPLMHDALDIHTLCNLNFKQL